MRWLLALLWAARPVDAEKRIALTFDVFPREESSCVAPDERPRRIIAALGAAKVRQVAFI
jgi:peptidoglycan-N-acetylglucosamine deacetylase